MMLPLWFAWTVQVPFAMRVIVAPFVPPEVHIDVVVVVNPTDKPELAVAFTVNGDWFNFRLLSAPKEIVWLAFCAVTVANTSGAAA